jgi:quercetin dioxygenase-like cupin family protein
VSLWNLTQGEKEIKMNKGKRQLKMLPSDCIACQQGILALVRQGIHEQVKSLLAKNSELSEQDLCVVLTMTVQNFGPQLMCLSQHAPDQEDCHKVVLLDVEVVTVALIAWEKQNWTAWHDHNSKYMAVYGVEGECNEERWEGDNATAGGNVTTRTYSRGTLIVSDPAVPHRLGGASGVTLHVYTPSLNKMNKFMLENGQLIPLSASVTEADSGAPQTPLVNVPLVADAASSPLPNGTTTILAGTILTPDVKLSEIPANDTWDIKASVRRKKLPNVLMEELEQGKQFFSSSLAPIASHPMIVAMGEGVIRKVLALYLIASTRFTDFIEDEVVLPTALDIANLKLGLEFSAALRIDARRCVVDEAHHSLFTKRIEVQVSQVSGVVVVGEKHPLFTRKLRRAIRNAPREYRHLISLCFRGDFSYFGILGSSAHLVKRV